MQLVSRSHELLFATTVAVWPPNILYPDLAHQATVFGRQTGLVVSSETRCPTWKKRQSTAAMPLQWHRHFGVPMVCRVQCDEKRTHAEST